MSRTISTRIPQEWIDLIEQHIVGPAREYSNTSEYLRDLIRDDMKKRGLFQAGGQ